MTDVNRDKIIAAAKDAGMQGMLTDVVTTLDEIERFWQIAFEAGRQAERGEIANWIDSTDCTKAPKSVAVWVAEMLHTYAEAIRARRTK